MMMMMMMTVKMKESLPLPLSLLLPWQRLPLSKLSFPHRRRRRIKLLTAVPTNHLLILSQHSYCSPQRRNSLLQQTNKKLACSLAPWPLRENVQCHRLMKTSGEITLLSNNFISGCFCPRAAGWIWSFWVFVLFWLFQSEFRWRPHALLLSVCSYFCVSMSKLAEREGDVVDAINCVRKPNKTGSSSSSNFNSLTFRRLTLWQYPCVYACKKIIYARLEIL